MAPCSVNRHARPAQYLQCLDSNTLCRRGAKLGLACGEMPLMSNAFTAILERDGRGDAEDGSCGIMGCRDGGSHAVASH